MEGACFRELQNEAHLPFSFLLGRYRFSPVLFCLVWLIMVTITVTFVGGLETTGFGNGPPTLQKKIPTIWDPLRPALSPRLIYILILYFLINILILHLATWWIRLETRRAIRRQLRSAIFHRSNIDGFGLGGGGMAWIKEILPSLKGKNTCGGGGGGGGSGVGRQIT